MREVIDAIRLRRARRAFESRAVPAEVQATLWEAVSLAPSHGNNQPVRLVVAEGAEPHEALVCELQKPEAEAKALLFLALKSPVDKAEDPLHRTCLIVLLSMILSVFLPFHSLLLRALWWLRVEDGPASRELLS